MNIQSITDSHLINRIAYFERFLDTKPFPADSEPSDSWGVQSAMDCENQHNDQVEEKVKGHIKYMKSIKRKRGI